jgi:hypothetical protein
VAPAVAAADPAPAGDTAPDCAWDTARRAGDARLGGYRYLPADAAPPPGTAACYPVAGAPTLVALPAGDGTGGDTVLLGTPDPLYNEHLDEDGNASLALQLLGSRPHVVWYLPGPDDAPSAGERRDLLGLLPAGWRWAAFQLAIAAALAAVWRARRLGPVVTEPLPVVVRAAETTEGRARLYHQAGARGHAAEALRTAARSRLARLAGVAAVDAHAPAVLPPAVAARTGDPVAAVHGLLFGPPPADDTALVRLADDLDALERRMTQHPEPEGKDEE